MYINFENLVLRLIEFLSDFPGQFYYIENVHIIQNPATLYYYLVIDHEFDVSEPTVKKIVYRTHHLTCLLHVLFNYLRNIKFLVSPTDTFGFYHCPVEQVHSCIEYALVYKPKPDDDYSLDSYSTELLLL